MRTLSLLLAFAVALHATSVRAEEPPAAPTTRRGALTGVGLGLLVAGLTSAGLGTAGLVSALDATQRSNAYVMARTSDTAAIAALDSQWGRGSWLALLGYSASVLALTAGIILLAVDRPRPLVAFVPTASGGAFVFSGQF